MPFFKIYHGMGGGFGGAQYDYTGEFENGDEAMEEARRLAVEDYESFEGSHGIMDIDDCRRALLIDAGVDEDAIDDYSGDFETLMEEYDVSDEDAAEMYEEELESWITFYVKPADGPDDTEEEDDDA